MEQIKAILQKLLYPSWWVLLTIPLLSFTALTLIFVTKSTESALAYLIYGMSAYSLTILLVVLPRLTKQIKSAIIRNKAVKRFMNHKIVGRYFNDITFRGSVGIYQGMTVNFLYTVFHIVAGIRYHSAWFISMAVYYLVLGMLRVYLIFSYHHCHADKEYHCYRKTAGFLFLLNIPMGGMIVLMVRSNSGFSYPGYIIYLSALYTFYIMIIAVVNLVKFRKLGSPILSAAKVLNFVSAMMSILGLQTAMISRFSEQGENYRRTMNAITGSFVYAIVILIALYMLLNKTNSGKKVEAVEEIGK